LVVLNNNHTDPPISQSPILEHANHVAPSTGDFSKVNIHTEGEAS
jgi:hypothetical protein